MAVSRLHITGIGGVRADKKHRTEFAPLLLVQEFGRDRNSRSSRLGNPEDTAARPGALVNPHGDFMTNHVRSDWVIGERRSRVFEASAGGLVQQSQQRRVLPLYGQILAGLDPQRTYDELVALMAPAEPVLLCYEVPPFTAPQPIPQAGLTTIGRQNWCHCRLARCGSKKPSASRSLSSSCHTAHWPRHATRTARSRKSRHRMSFRDRT